MWTESNRNERKDAFADCSRPMIRWTRPRRAATSSALAVAGAAALALSLAAALAAGGLASPLAAQIVRGNVVEASSGRPIIAGFVTLIDEDGTRRVSVLTDPEGRYLVRAPRPGTYTLQVERIGYHASIIPDLELAADQVLVQRVEVAVRAIDLEELAVEVEAGVCRLPADLAAETHRIWDEARRALEIAVWTHEAADPPFQTVVYERSRDLVTLDILDDEQHERRLVSGRGQTPFVSASAGALNEEGYVRREGENVYRYFGLDAATLLSDEFQQTHCFRAVPPDADRMRIGLGFEPIPGRELPDVKGVLWLDQETLELRSLEFEHTRHFHAFDLPENRFGSQVSFERLENGAWIVDRWVLRMPHFKAAREGEESLSYFTPERAPVSERERLMDLAGTGLIVREEGGNVHFMAAPAVTESDEIGAVLEGVVQDSARGVPLAGAIVFLTDGQHVATTGDDGRFRLSNLPDGRHEVAFFHAYTDDYRLSLAPNEVELAGGTTSTIELLVPAGAACALPEDPDAPPTASLLGFVLDRTTGEPVAGAAVEVSWSSERRTSLWEALRGIYNRGKNTVDAVADADGRYLLCGIGLGDEIQVRVGDRSNIRFEIVEPGVMHRDLFAP